MSETQPPARLEARLPRDVYAMLRHAADIQGQTLSDFVVSAAREAARRTIEDSAIFRLAAEDQQRFARALIDPPELASAMIRARDRRRVLIGK